jgi:hypothetical protein
MSASQLTGLSLFETRYVAGVETLKSGQALLSLADSADSVTWACRTPTLMPGVTPPARGPVPILAAWLDAPALVAMFDSSTARGSFGTVLAHLRRLEAELAADGDLFRLTLRAPLKE